MSHRSPDRPPVPMFHDLTFLVERVPRPSDLEEGKLATLATLRLAHAVFDLARRDNPHHVVILRQGARIIRRYEPDLL